MWDFDDQNRFKSSVFPESFSKLELACSFLIVAFICLSLSLEIILKWGICLETSSINSRKITALRLKGRFAV